MLLILFSDSDDSDTDIPQHKFLAASLEYQPGYFACDIKWQTQFILHPRLKTGSGRSGLSRGMCQYHYQFLPTIGISR